MKKETIFLVVKKAVPILFFYLLFATVLRLWDSIEKLFSGLPVNWFEEISKVDYTGILLFAVPISVYIGYRDMKRKQAKTETREV